MLNANDYTYWCVRNKVKKNTIISCSGKLPCLCCGDIFNTNDDMDQPSGFYDGAYNDRFRNCGSVICPSCEHKYTCDDCEKVTGMVKEYDTRWHRKLCKSCWEKQIYYCPSCNKP